MRVFIAVDLENKDALAKLTALQRAIVETGADVKLVEPQNLHFTLKFLGEVDANLILKVKEALSEIDAPQIKVVYQGVGAFPSIWRPNVLWVGSDREGGALLSNLAEIVESKIAHLKVGDHKPFTPHLTVARVKSGRNKEALIKLINSNLDTVFGEDLLTQIKLKKSDLTPKGPIYTDLYVKNLVG
ncbi:MAG: RNA 2',3'-cyclic phosphodiesterase [Nitrososphaerales archaeon]